MSSAGDMLRLARQRLGFTQKDAAARLGIVQPLLSRLENGVMAPDDALLMRASRVYEVPVDFFDQREPVYGPPVSVHTMLRGASDVTARELDTITAELNLRVFHLGRLLEGVDYNVEANVPALDVDQYGEPAKIAATIRAHWGIPSSAIRNLMSWVERAGIVVAYSGFGGASVSGVTFKVPGRPPIILLNAAHPADRMRYTLAHELGHLVMHRFPNERMEEEANDFASALLLPEAEMRAAFNGRRVTLPLLASLKPEWKVSMQALLFRASRLGCISQNQARYLWQQIAAHGWRTREPPELDFPPEEPTVLPAILQAHLSELGYSHSELAHMLKLHESEIARMYNIALQDEQPPPKAKAKLRLVR